MFSRISILALLLAVALALPGIKHKKEKKRDTSLQITPEMETALEYELCLKEFLEAFNPEFRRELYKTAEALGRIAKELEHVNHHVRSKLDKIKRREWIEENRKKYEQESKEEEEEKHERIHYPRNKAQLEDLWDKQDIGPHFWDENEDKALLVKNSDRLCQSGFPQGNMRERAKEIGRMREHLFQEADRNQDRFISLKEFMNLIKSDEFNKGRHQKEVKRLLAGNLLPPYHNMLQGYYPQHPQRQSTMQKGHPKQLKMNYKQIKQQYHQQKHQQQFHHHHHHHQKQPLVNLVPLNPNQVYQQVPQQQSQLMKNAKVQHYLEKHQKVPQKQQQQHQKAPQQQQQANNVHVGGAKVDVNIQKQRISQQQVPPQQAPQQQVPHKQVPHQEVPPQQAPQQQIPHLQVPQQPDSQKQQQNIPQKP